MTHKSHDRRVVVGIIFFHSRSFIFKINVTMSILRSVLSLILLMIMITTTTIAQRLPINVKPNHYMIKLMPKMVLDDFTFDGLTSINISILVAETKIILHAKDLTFDETSTSLIGPDGAQIIPTTHTIDVLTDFLTLDFTTTPLAVGVYVLNLKYTGQLNVEPRGFYRKSYIDILGKNTWLAMTQFAPINARRAFPCFDEPSYKSEFEISIQHLKHYTAVSNMPVSHTTIEMNNPEICWSHFEVTPIMSTYQVAFVISELKDLPKVNDEFRVWSQSGKIRKTHYALSISRKNLKIFEDYTNFEHVIPKMDIFAIPELTDSSTDSWGLVAYEENSILIESNATTANDKQEIALTLTRGLVNQWFGGLVSPDWWKLSWLDAGLGKYFEYFINDQAETKWRMMDQFVIKILQARAFFIDDSKDQLPLSSEVSTPEEITNIFNRSSANKAASIIRMISHVIGAKVFRIGLRAYIKNNAFGAVGPDVFIDALTSAKGAPTDVDLKAFLSTWINNIGYPLVKLEELNTTAFDMKQVTYLLNGTINAATQIWQIPISYAENPLDFDSTKPKIWINQAAGTPLATPISWFVVNNHMTGYYRVSYKSDMWLKIVNCMKNDTCYSEIPASNRGQLLDDSFALAQSGYYANYDQFFDLSTYLREEDDYVPWFVAFRAFAIFDKALANTEIHGLFQLYIKKIIVKLEKNVGYDEMIKDDHIKKLNRIHLVQWACQIGSVNCLVVAQEKLVQHVFESIKISTDLRKVVLCAGIREANSLIWEKTMIHYHQSKDKMERQDVLEALGCSSDPTILNSYLMRTLDPESKLSLGATITSIVTQSENGVDVAMDFVKENFELIVKNDHCEKCILDYVNDIASRMTNEDQLTKLDKFINSLLWKHKDLADALTQSALPLLMKNLEWLEKYGAAISTFLEKENLVDVNFMTVEASNA